MEGIAQLGGGRGRALGLVAVIAASVLAVDLASPAEATDGSLELISQPTGAPDPDSASASFGGASENGARVVFTTTEKLTADDNDTNRLDVYERAGGVTTLVSGPTGVTDPNTGDVSYRHVSRDGSRVLFSTTQRLTADDNDTNRLDVYERAGGVTTLVSGSSGVADPNTADAQYAGASADGARVFFYSTQKMTADDTDTNRGDLYQRAGGQTTLVSAPTGVADPNTADAYYAGNSRDGARVFFATTQKLAADDADTNRQDVYERSGGQTALLSKPTGVADPNTAEASFAGSSEDGTRVFLLTPQKLTAEDADTNRYDVYQRAGGETTLLSAPTGVPDPNTGDAFYRGASRDGSRVFMLTAEKLAPDDPDTNRLDVYERSAGQTALLSKPTGIPDANTADASFSGASEDGTRVFITTSQKLVPEDADTNRSDVYQRAGGETTLLSAPTGVPDPNTGDALFGRASADGARVFMYTNQKLAADDADTNQQDIYEREAGVTSLVSGAKGIADPNTAAVLFRGISRLGNRLFFRTTQRLVPGDLDQGRNDIYAAGSPDQTGAGPGGGGTTGRDRTAPRVRALKVTRRFRASSSLPRAAARTPTGGIISFTLSERATGRLAVAQRSAGRRVGRRCLAPTRARRRRARCTRLTNVRTTIPLRARSGRVRIRFYGRLNRRSSLRPGAYRLTVTATDTARNRSRPARADFTLLPAAKRRSRR